MLNYGNDSAINGMRRHSSSAFWHIAAVGCSVRAEDLNAHFREQPVHGGLLFSWYNDNFLFLACQSQIHSEANM